MELFSLLIFIAFPFRILPVELTDKHLIDLLINNGLSQISTSQFLKIVHGLVR
jgi:hypothetical protein